MGIINQLDLGRVYGNVAAIEGQRVQNELARMQMDAYGVQMEKDQQFTNALGQVDFSAGMTGNTDALGSLYALDPEHAAQITEALKGFDEAKLAGLQQENETIARTLAPVVTGDRTFEEAVASLQQQGIDTEGLTPDNVQATVMEHLDLNTLAGSLLPDPNRTNSEIVPGSAIGAGEGFFEVKRREDGSIADVQSLSGGGTTITNNMGSDSIDYGDPPTDMSWARDANGRVVLQADPATGFMRPVAVPIAGGPVDLERTAAEEAAASAEETAQARGTIQIQEIDRALNIIDSADIPTTGLGGWLTSSIPGTPGHDLSNLLNTVRGQVGFDQLQAMRDASPTGGALGQVSERENTLLQAQMGSLEQSQSKDQLTYNLKRLQLMTNEIINDTNGDGKGLTAEALKEIDAQLGPAPGMGSGLPEGIPEGSTQTGTLNGKPVYTAPDGKMYTVE